MLKFGLEIALGMVQKSYAAIFEILIFRDFSGGQSPKMADLDQNIPLTIPLTYTDKFDSCSNRRCKAQKFLKYCGFVIIFTR